MKNVLTILKPRLAHHQVGTRRCAFGWGFLIFAVSSWHLGPDTIFLLCVIFIYLKLFENHQTLVSTPKLGLAR